MRQSACVLGSLAFLRCAEPPALALPIIDAAAAQLSGVNVTELGCPYFHPVACVDPKVQNFLDLWAKKVQCWLCDNQEMVSAAHVLIRELLKADLSVTRDRAITRQWLDTCLSGYLLAMFATTRSTTVQTWRFYEFGLNIIWACQFDDAAFYKLFDITPSQIAYVFFLLGYTRQPMESTLPIQGEEWRSFGKHGAFGALDPPAWSKPLVIDIGMGLGADTRYYLSQGFRVVGVEANPLSVHTAVSDAWTAPFLRSGQLSVLNAAISPPGKGTGSRSFYALPHRPEMSNAEEWITRDGAQRMSVRTIECADLLRVFGRAVYMKIDIESNSIDCLESLHHAHESRGSSSEDWARPPLLSLEMESTSNARNFLERLEALGYSSYKVCRQYVYSPAPCEQGAYGPEVPGCGSGPFGNAAVDYLRGVQWNSIANLQNDMAWATEFEGGLDWFDLHVRLP